MRKVGHHLSDAEIAARYEAFQGTLAMRPYFYPAVADFVGNVGDGSVLDAGCGPGLLLAEIQKRNLRALLFGLEIAQANVEATRRLLNGKGDIRQGSVLAPLPFPEDQRFDLILLTEVLEHLKSPVQALQNVARYLKSGGQLVITFPNAAAWLPLSLLAELLATQIKIFRGFLPHEHPLRTEQPIDTAFSRREVLSMIKDAGLKVIQEECREVFPYLLEIFYKFTPGIDPLPRWQALDRICTRLHLFNLGYRIFLRCVRS